MSYELYIRKGETAEDAMIREIKYQFSETKTSLHIGPYKMCLAEQARGVLDAVIQHLQDQSTTRDCEACLGAGYFGVSIPGSGSVEKVGCKPCDSTGRLSKDAPIPEKESEDSIGNRANTQFWGR